LAHASISEPKEYDWPESRREPVRAVKNLSVAIDGTYVRADRMMGLGEYHVVAGRVEREGRLGDYFAWLPQNRSCDAVAFMRAALEANGWTQKSKVRVLADGADGLSSLITTEAEKNDAQGSGLVSYQHAATTDRANGRWNRHGSR
jgi:hypothetical protein